MQNLTKLILEKSGSASESDLFEALSLDALEGLDVDLVSIWQFEHSQTSLTCNYCIGKNNTHDLVGTIITKEKFPNYFNSVIEGISLKIDDIYNHPATKELVDGYFKVHGILSLLDYLIYEDGRIVGLICCETTSKKRAWQDEDIDLIRILTVMVGAELKNTHKN